MFLINFKIIVIRRVGFSPNKTSGGIFAEKSTDNLIYII